MLKLVDSQVSKTCGVTTPCGFESHPRHLLPLSSMPKAKLIRKDFVWTPEMAYAVGLLTTDGCLSPDKRHISLSSSDKSLLYTFMRCLGKTNTITLNAASTLAKKPSYRVQFGDVLLYSWLQKIGLHSNKSLTLRSLAIEDAYYPDFLRGHLDGDGSIITYTDAYLSHKNPKYIYMRIFVYFRSASKEHILWVQNTITRHIGIKGSIQAHLSKSQKGKAPVYRLKFSSKEAKILLNWIYYKPELPCLERKHALAKQFVHY